MGKGKKKKSTAPRTDWRSIFAGALVDFLVGLMLLLFDRLI